MSFGFSVGDLIAAVQLSSEVLAKITDICNVVGGSDPLRKPLMDIQQDIRLCDSQLRQTQDSVTSYGYGKSAEPAKALIAVIDSRLRDMLTLLDRVAKFVGSSSKSRIKSLKVVLGPQRDIIEELRTRTAQVRDGCQSMSILMQYDVSRRTIELSTPSQSMQAFPAQVQASPAQVRISVDTNAAKLGRPDVPNQSNATALPSDYLEWSDPLLENILTPNLQRKLRVLSLPVKAQGGLPANNDEPFDDSALDTDREHETEDVIRWLQAERVRLEPFPSPRSKIARSLPKESRDEFRLRGF